MRKLIIVVCYGVIFSVGIHLVRVHQVRSQSDEIETHYHPVAKESTQKRKIVEST